MFYLYKVVFRRVNSNFKINKHQVKFLVDTFKTSWWLNSRTVNYLAGNLLDITKTLDSSNYLSNTFRVPQHTSHTHFKFSAVLYFYNRQQQYIILHFHKSRPQQIYRFYFMNPSTHKIFALRKGLAQDKSNKDISK